MVKSKPMISSITPPCDEVLDIQYTPRAILEKRMGKTISRKAETRKKKNLAHRRDNVLDVLYEHTEENIDEHRCASSSLMPCAL
jgi:hypothetical protein